jgi:hypothetical protein
MSIESFFHNFSNIGYMSVKFSSDELAPVIEEIQHIQQHPQSAKSLTSMLAGNIKQEYALTNSASYLAQLIMPHIMQYENYYGYVKTMDSWSVPGELFLDEPWVNFQQRGEFNPTHNHSGAMSFVIWISLPYDMQTEMAHGPGRDSVKNVPGHFELQYTDTLGNIRNHVIPADRRYENTMLIFPSAMLHSVYPFYSTDQTRISVSGNFKLRPVGQNI